MNTDLHHQEAMRNALPKDTFIVGDLVYRALEDRLGVTVCGLKGLVEVVIPAQIEYNGYTYDVLEIADGAFASSEITSVVISNGVTRIGEEAFNCCYHLQSAVIPGSIKEIGTYAFDCCGFDSLTLEEGITCIDAYTFPRCEMESLVIPNSVTHIGEGAFHDCENLTSLTLGKNIECIEAWQIDYLEKVIVPKSAPIASTIQERFPDAEIIYID